MAFLEGLGGLIVAILMQPAILPLIVNFVLWFRKSTNANTLVFIKAMTNAYQEVTNAQTVEQKQAAAEALSDLVHSIKH